nr:MAG TPA: 5' nucleotidase [Caudoviricetes sp.]
MKKIFLDFDNTLVESNKRIIEILTERYNLNKTEEDLKDYFYKSIYNKVTKKEIEEIYESQLFFEKLEFKPSVLQILDKYKEKYKIIITTKGTSTNLLLKKQWIEENLDNKIKFLGLEGTSFDKHFVNMKGGIQIDDNLNCLKTNAEIHILYKDGHSYSWQRGYENKDILLVDTWDQIDEILNFYSTYNYKTLDKI